MPRILYGVSPIGLGHATRSLVIVDQLRRRGADVELFSGGKAAEFIQAGGFPVASIVDDAVPRVVDGEMSGVSLWYLRSWLAQRRNVKEAQRLLDSYDPDLVVCDEEFSGITVAEKGGKKRVFISDELSLGFARTWLARRIEGRVWRWYRKLQDSVDLLIVPETGRDEGNRRFVGPIARVPTLSCEGVRTKYGIPPGQMVLLSMSGSGIGMELGDAMISAMVEAGFQGATLVITGNRGRKFSGERVLDLGLITDNQNLIACADLVVSTAGKSTIDEAAAAGTPVVTIPIRYHAEQERNAKVLGYSHHDILRLPTLIREKIGKRGERKHFDGEIAAADAILSLMEPGQKEGPPL